MATTTVKEEYVGDPPLCHSIQMLRLDDGSIEVVMRTLPDRDPDSDMYPPPLLAIERYTNQAEAEFRYKTVLGLMRRLGAPP
jgi:hypothetical protein